jgi:hypothetical protein
VIILKILGAGNSETDAARAAQAAKSTVTYWKDKFLDMGLIQLVSRDVFQTFRLTPFGSKILTRGEGSELVVLEDFAWRFTVLEGERRRVDWVRLGSPRNWVKLGVRVGSVRVVRTSRSVIVHPGRLKGWDCRELERLAVRTVEWTRRVLEDRFGMLLEDEGVPLHEPVFRFYSEEAKEDVKHGTVICEGVGSTDNSPPERVPHEEYSGVERAHARLLLPDSVKRLELKVDSLSDCVVRLTESVGSVVGALERLLPPAEPESRPSQNTMDKYVF